MGYGIQDKTFVSTGHGGYCYSSTDYHARPLGGPGRFVVASCFHCVFRPHPDFKIT